MPILRQSDWGSSPPVIFFHSIVNDCTNAVEIAVNIQITKNAAPGHLVGLAYVCGMHLFPVPGGCSVRCRPAQLPILQKHNKNLQYNLRSVFGVEKERDTCEESNTTAYAPRASFPCAKPLRGQYSYDRMAWPAPSVSVNWGCTTIKNTRKRFNLQAKPGC